MKVNKGLIEDIKGTISTINSNMKNKTTNNVSITRPYLVDDNTITTITDLMCHPGNGIFETTATIMAIVNKYTSQNGLQSPENVNTSMGIWVAANGFDDTCAKRAKEMSELYREMWNNGTVICVFDNNIKILVED